MDEELFYYCVEETKSYELNDINGLYRTEYNSVVVKNFLNEKEATECLTFLNNLNRCKYRYTMRKIVIKNPKLYLVGDTNDWQKTVTQLIHKKFTILNQENEMFNVEWENKMLKDSNIILFWFPKDTNCSIALYHLGIWSSQTLVPIIIGIHPEYKLRTELIKRINLKGFSTVDSLEKAADLINESYSRFFKYDEYKDNHFSDTTNDNQNLTLFRKDRKEEYRKLIYQITNPEVNTVTQEININPEINKHSEINTTNNTHSEIDTMVSQQININPEINIITNNYNTGSSGNGSNDSDSTDSTKNK